MKAAGIIEQFNTERPNQIDDSLKLGWLRKCEQMIINEVLIRHEHDLESEDKISLTVSGSTLKVVSAGTFTEHIDSFDMDSEMLVQEPYDDLYIYYLDTRVALQNNDTKRYNVANAQYNNAYYAFQQYFNRTNKTIKTKKNLLRHDSL